MLQCWNTTITSTVVTQETRSNRFRVDQLPVASHVAYAIFCTWMNSKAAGGPSQKFYDKYIYIYIGHRKKSRGIWVSSFPLAYGCIPLEKILACVNKTKSYLYKYPSGLVGQKTESENRESHWWQSVRKPGIYRNYSSRWPRYGLLCFFVTQWCRVFI